VHVVIVEKQCLYIEDSGYQHKKLTLIFVVVDVKNSNFLPFSRGKTIFHI